MAGYSVHDFTDVKKAELLAELGKNELEYLHSWSDNIFKRGDILTGINGIERLKQSKPFEDTYLFVLSLDYEKKTAVNQIVNTFERANRIDAAFSSQLDNTIAKIVTVKNMLSDLADLINPAYSLNVSPFDNPIFYRVLDRIDNGLDDFDLKKYITKDADGKITYNWENIKELLWRDPEEVTDAEYAILASLYLSMDNESVSIFINESFRMPEDAVPILGVPTDLYMSPQLKKVKELSKGMVDNQCALISAIAQIDADELYEKNGIYFPDQTPEMLKTTILNAAKQNASNQLLRYTLLDNVTDRHWYYSPKFGEPYIEITFNNKEHRCLAIGNGDDYYNWGYEESKRERIEIEVSMDTQSANLTIDELQGYILEKTGFAPGGIVFDGVASACRDELLNNMIEGLVEECVKDAYKEVASSGITFGVGLLLNIGLDIAEAVQDYHEGEEQHKIAELGKYANNFNMTAVLVNDKGNRHLECYTGERTDQIRSYLNYFLVHDDCWAKYGGDQESLLVARAALLELFGDGATMNDFIRNPDGVGVTMSDILRRPEEVSVLLAILPKDIRSEITTHGGTELDCRRFS